jgi:hypothetical protein
MTAARRPPDVRVGELSPSAQLSERGRKSKRCLLVKVVFGGRAFIRIQAFDL